MAFLGIDIGGTNIKCTLIDADSSVLASTQVPTNPDGSIDAILRGINGAITNLNRDSIAFEGACFGIPGPVDSVTNTVVMAPNLGWMASTDICGPAAELLGCSVVVANDATCAASGEAHFGAGREYKSFLLLTLGTAVGAALVQDGRPFSGYGRYGGELGHIPLVHGGIPCSCGIDGCFEQYGSATALTRIAASCAKKDPTSMMASADVNALKAEDVVAAAIQGDCAALDAFDEYTTYLAKGTAGLVNIFRPDAVIYAGGLANAGELLRKEAELKLAKYTCASEIVGSPRVVLSGNASNIGALGAAMIASQQASL